MIRFSRFLTALVAVPVLIAAAAGAPALAQGTADDSACVSAGLLGEEFGLCNAYCEAMDCDGDHPQASAKACEKVQTKFEAIALDPVLPCLADQSQNAPPTLDLDINAEGTGATATFVSFGDAVPIAVEVEITDDDGGLIMSATVTLTNPLDGVEETLSLTSAGDSLVTDLGGSWNFDSATGVLTIEAIGDLTDYAEILQEVTYDNSDGSPLTVSRSILVTVSDGEADSDPAVSLITVSVGCPCTAISSGALMTHPASAPFGRDTDGNLINYGFEIWGCTGSTDDKETEFQITYSTSHTNTDYWYLNYNVGEERVEGFRSWCLQEFSIYADLGSGQGRADGTITLIRDYRRTFGPGETDQGIPPGILHEFTIEQESACEADRFALRDLVAETLADENGDPVACFPSP